MAEIFVGYAGRKRWNLYGTNKPPSVGKTGGGGVSGDQLSQQMVFL